MSTTWWSSPDFCITTQAFFHFISWN